MSNVVDPLAGLGNENEEVPEVGDEGQLDGGRREEVPSPNPFIPPPNPSISPPIAVVPSTGNPLGIPPLNPLAPAPAVPGSGRLGWGRPGSPGAGRSTDGVYVQNPLGLRSRTPPRGLSQDSTQQAFQGNYFQPTFPIQKVEAVTADNFKVWRNKMRMAAVNMRCARAFEGDMAGTLEDNAAQFLLMNSVPPEWQVRITEMSSAYEGIVWVCNQFDGGANTYYVDELERKFAGLKYSSKESWEQYVMRASNLATSLTSNGHAVSKTTLVTKIVHGLPELFDSSKASLRLTGKGWTLDQLCSEIKAEAYNLEITKGKGPPARAMLSEEKPAFSGKHKQQGSGGGQKGSNQQKKIKGQCWNCGKTGHSFRDCKSPDTNFAHKPGNKSDGADAAKALVSTDKGGRHALTGQEWVVDSGASHHITGNPILLHDYVQYPEPQPLSTAIKADSAHIVGQGTVCMEGINGSTFWLEEVRYVPGLTQNLFSIASGIAQDLIMGASQKGEHVSVKLPSGEKLCEIYKVNSQYLLDAKALDGTDQKVYFSMLAREGRTTDVYAMLSSYESADSYELWHRRLGHPSPSAMWRLVKECMAKGVKIPDSLLRKAKTVRCECCILGKQSHLPFPLSDSTTARPLELIHMDICGPLENETNSGGRYFLTIMDDFSKYAEVVIVKKKSEVKHAAIEVLTRWETLREVFIQYLRTDGGKEFTGKLVTDFCKKKGITAQVTPRHTPEQNGKIERLNRTFKEKVRCMMIDSKLPVEWWGFALEYAAYLRNCLPASGKSATPFELFHHKQPDLTLVRVFGSKAYVRLEKRDKGLTKLGPQSESGIFLGMEPNTKAYRILIGTEIRVSRHVVFSEEKFRSTRVVEGPMPVEHQEYDEEPEACEEDYVTLSELRREQVYLDPFMSAQFREARTGETHLVEDDTDEEVTGPAAAPLEGTPRTRPNLPRGQVEHAEFDFSHTEDTETENDSVTDPSSDDEDGDYSGAARGQHENEVGATRLREDTNAAPPEVPVQGATNRYSLRSRGPVTPGNVVALRVMALTVANDMSDVIIPKSYAEAMRTPQAPMWTDSMGEEMNSIVSKDTFVWVPRPKDAKVIPSRWVYATKQDAMGNIQRYKSRVVAKGFKQVEGIDFNETYAPVCNQDTRRVLFAISAQMRYHMHQMDVKTAFLNGELTDETYCEPPPGYSSGNGMVWKLKKALYGLRQAPRAWHECLVKALVAGDFAVSQADPGLFMKQTKAGTIYLITYVDDMVIAGADLSEVETVKQYLSGVFEVTDLGEVAHFLGNIVVRNSNSVRVSNPVKVKELLADYGIESPKKVLTPMDHSFVVTEMSVEAGKTGGSGKPLGEGHRYNELIGSLMYLANTTRPDLQLAVGLLSRFRSKPTTAHWSAALRVLGYLYQNPDKGLEYSGNHDVICYVDSAFADDRDIFASTMGYTFILNGAAVSWTSKKLREIAVSTVEAEYTAFHLAACHAVWMQQLLWEMVGRKGPITIYCDSTGCIANLKNFITTGHTKHIGVKYHASRQMVANQKVAPVYVQTDENIADVFTKPLVNAKFSKFVDGLGMT